MNSTGTIQVEPCARACLRDWGYVFWDLGRLQRWSVFAIPPEDDHRNVWKKRSRHHRRLNRWIKEDRYGIDTALGEVLTRSQTFGATIGRE